MNNKNMNKASNDQKSCLFTGLFVFTTIWVIGITIVAQVTMWIMEQTLFEAAFLFPDLRWLIIVLYVILVGSPLIMYRFIINNSVGNHIYQFWLTILLLGIFLIPCRFLAINDAFTVSLIQIFGLSIYLGILLYFLKRRKVSVQWKSKTEIIFIMIVISGLYCIPWALWGALGSPLDIGLNLIAGLLSGLFLSISIQQLFSGLVSENEIIKPGGQLFFGLVLFVGLIVFSTVFGQNGQQWL